MKTRALLKTESSARENLIYATVLFLVWFVFSLFGPGAHAKSDESGLLPDPMESIQIIGGTQVSTTQTLSRYVVAVYDVEAGALCTGSLIQPKLIVTAAHCVTDSAGNDTPVSNLRVVFGTNLRLPGIQVMAVEKVMVAPDWKLNSESELNTGDIAIVQISNPAPSSFRPALVLSSASMLKKNRLVRLAGYGISNGVNKTGSGILREVDVTMADPVFSNTEVLLDQRKGKGACHGDSGGPAYLISAGRLLLFGVTSRGVKDTNDDCSQFAAYTNMMAYQGWLTQQAVALTGNAALGSQF